MRSTLWFRSVLCLASASLAAGLTGVTYSLLRRGFRLADDPSDVGAVAAGILILAIANGVIWWRWRTDLPGSWFWLGPRGQTGVALVSALLCGLLYWLFATMAGPLLIGGDMNSELVQICSVLMVSGVFLVALAFFGLVPAPFRPPERVVLCPKCGYNLTGLYEARCPECGTRYTLDELLVGMTGRNRPGRQCDTSG